MIHLDNVTLVRNGKKILNELNWRVRAGEHWAVLGLNGAGKTALLNLINGYVYPSAGSVKVLGHTFGTYPIAEIRKRIGWVSSSLQERLHKEDSVEEVVVSGKFASIGLYDRITEEDIEKATQLICQLGCEHLLNRSYRHLSQGEKQRILIARGLMASPSLLILDEPCTGLDFLAREQLLTSIERISESDQAPTILYVTHHIEEILPIFTKTLLLREGEIISASNTEDVLNSTSLSDFFGVAIEMEIARGRSWMYLKS
ncbi:ABC transporter ATP-binding protein [Bacillus horti]|uniref:Iron complex transport system ATP-binding protein n=1 Tax=Caldalkalibacillus horti TaxID=77523 RepID=A0ABT9W4D1_9BACI|nr:iron complex transport system ATP-binding protein [Bacillus horti]